MCAQWERHTSRSFHVCNGVKQGAVISPILFAVYYDELIAKLARSGYGCRISQHFVGALSYADDITLLSPSLQGLQYMVNICEEYGKEFHVTFKATHPGYISFYWLFNNLVKLFLVTA